MKIYGEYIAAMLMLLLLPLQSFSSDPSAMVGYIPLSDRIGEADAVVLGTSFEKSAVETKTDGVFAEYTPVCKIRVEEVIWGTDIKKGDTVIVIIGQ